MVYGAFTLVAAVGLLWLAYRRPRPRRWLLPRRVVPRATLSAVEKQHRHLQAGGLLGETACERTKAHFRELLETGRADLIRRELRAGLDFAVQVRALTDLGTPEAGHILKRLLRARLTSDADEQSWYWVDLATALRQLNRTDALPAVLRCAEAAAGSPQGDLLAAEAVTFAGFGAALSHPAGTVSDRARAALVVATRAARRGGFDIAKLVRAGLGDHLADVTGRAIRSTDPWATAAMLEAERLARRLGHWARRLPPDARPLADEQAARLARAAEHRRAWLAGAAARLRDRFPQANEDERGAILRCLGELRADVAPLFPQPPDRRAAWWADAVRALRWSRSSVVGPALASQAVRLTHKARHHDRAAVVLAALKGHACYESERVLLRAAAHTSPALRRAAVGALGWWAPFDPNRVVPALRAAHADPDAGTRAAATGALARLGVRSALAEITAGLTSEETAIRQATAARVAAEGLTWLWPDLEDAAASSDADTAFAAAEALEHLRERQFGLSG